MCTLVLGSPLPECQISFSSVQFKVIYLISIIRELAYFYGGQIIPGSILRQTAEIMRNRTKAGGKVAVTETLWELMLELSISCP